MLTLFPLVFSCLTLDFKFAVSSLRGDNFSQPIVLLPPELYTKAIFVAIGDNFGYLFRIDDILQTRLLTPYLSSDPQGWLHLKEITATWQIYDRKILKYKL